MSVSVKTICDFVSQMPDRDARIPALMLKKNNAWQDISWSQYHEQISTVSSALLALGIEPREKVAIMSNTRWEWSICDFAIMSIHAVTVPIYPTVTPEDLSYVLNNSETKILILESRAMLKIFLKIQEDCPSVRKVICLENLRKSDLEIITWDELLSLGAREKKGKKDLFDKLCQSTTRQDTATLIYTSGTTGLPRGVVLTHEQIMSEVTEAFHHLSATKEDTTLTFLPYAHVLGRIESWGHVYVGFKMAYAESIEKIRSNLSEVQPTVMIAVPRIFEKIYSGIFAQLGNNVFRNKLFRWALAVGLKVGHLKLEKKSVPLALFAEYQLADRLILGKIREAFGGRLRFAVSGGAPLARDIALFFHACGVLILEGYGLTETTAAIFANTSYSYRFGTVGRPIGDVQVKIAEDGEILIRSKKVMKEYYNDPEATKEVFSEGWFHTGDIGELLPSGDLKITDRKKDLIKTAGGKYVAPQKLENLLKANSFISHILIHGDQKKYIVALLTLDTGFLKNFAEEKGLAYKDLSDLTQHYTVLELVRKAVAEANTHLASYETIKRFAILPHDLTVESGELTPSLKVKRKVLDRKYKHQIEALYT